jgi:tRNA pseudouridine55 synthase
VLLLLAGRATRLARFLGAGEKIYEATIRLGAATDTYDATGRPTTWTAASGIGSDVRSLDAIDPAAVEVVLGGFRGSFRQNPPPFSAKRIGGIRAYALARRKTPVAPSPVMVTVHALELLSLEGTRLQLRVAAEAGFYVRSLAHDIGLRLGCGGHLEALRRLRTGGFGVEEATPLHVIEAEGLEAVERLVPMTDLLPDLPGLVLTERGARRAAHGNAVEATDIAGQLSGRRSPAAADGPVRLVDRDGTLVAIAEFEDGEALHPVVVLV